MSAAEILGPTGRIAARLPHYEHRPQQLRMAERIEETLATGGHLVVEAGTGVGKSFAYLVPAVLAATAGGPVRRVVISTHTIALQEQLVAKDLPLLHSVLPREFTAVLAKGRGNYVSLRRLAAAATRAGSLFSEDRELDELRRLLDWAKRTDDGSLADLDFKPQGAIWDEVSSDSGNCLGRKCETYEQCFYYAARRRVHNAHLLIVNHALFFSDLALRQQGASILPDYDAVVFDEAHTLESVAGSHLGLSVGSGQVQYVLRKLFHEQANKGLLVHHKLLDAQQLCSDCDMACQDLFDDLLHWQQRQSGSGRVREPQIVQNNASPLLRQLAKLIRAHARERTDASDRQDLESASNRLTTLAGAIETWLAQELPDDVHWLDVSQPRRGGPRIQLCSAPVDVGPALRERLFESTRSVILTSATLASGDSFDFFRSRVGLREGSTLQVGSPFDYRSQAQLVLVRGLPDPSTDKAGFERRCAEMICRYVERSDGRAFVLFTSYEMMRSVARLVSPWLARHNMPLHNQADGTPRGALLRAFLSNPRSVLFGADSFWQGVDVRGDALTNVIIPKLPFSVPDQPLLQARLDAIRASGGDPFREYQLPEAVIKLRQGFGRLIRSQEDRGMVVILDPRIRTKSYGREFLRSLPQCQLVEEE